VEVALNLRSKPSLPIKPSTSEKKPTTAPHGGVVGSKSSRVHSQRWIRHHYLLQSFRQLLVLSRLYMISDFASVDVKGRVLLVSSVFAAWSRVWLSHIRGVHQSGNTFVGQYTLLFPEGMDATVYVLRQVVFVVEDGKVVGTDLVGLVGQLTESEHI
ncbi:uncharacterized protein BJ212DRAFT_1392805, partial [Suillus subaureus]